MSTVQNPRETRDCVAQVQRARRHLRISGRCGAPALDFGDVRIAGQLIEIPSCRTHFRALRDSPDPIALALTWAPEPPARVG
jgi:hypothetical protein